MSASVEIMTEMVEQVVSVPIQAVTVRDFSQIESKSDSTDTTSAEEEEKNDNIIAKEDLRRVVFKIVDGKAVMEEVTTGISDDSHLQIMNGDETGDMIVTGSYRILSRELEDGDAVKIDNNKFKRLMNADD
jgi:HlyD family secretion protein